MLVVGAGPAGLVLGNLLRAEGIDCLILERRSRAHVEHRARAGFLAANSVRILERNGLADGVNAGGQRHGTCSFRTDHGQFELNYGALGRREMTTVYPQQDLVRDLIAEFLDRGGDIRFDAAVSEVGGVGTDRPWVAAGDRRWHGRFVAGCDGRHGVSRAAVPAGAARRYQRTYGVSWLALLAEAPPSMSTVTYAIHANGFAGHMARTPSVTRYYLQCPPGDDPDRWPERRIWDELGVRMHTQRHGALKQGNVIERRIIDMRCDVIEPIQYGRLFLVGDAASLVSPAAAKGANLAIMAADKLARALATALRHGDEGPLSRYSADCMPHIWRAQEFSQWMIHLLCGGPANNDEEAAFQRAVQLARLDSLRTSRRHQDYFAESYVGI